MGWSRSNVEHDGTEKETYQQPHQAETARTALLVIRRDHCVHLPTPERLTDS
jgi:hypothetical protein